MDPKSNSSTTFVNLGLAVGRWTDNFGCLPRKPQRPKEKAAVCWLTLNLKRFFCCIGSTRQKHGKAAKCRVNFGKNIFRSRLCSFILDMKMDKLLNDKHCFADEKQQK